MKSKLLSFLVVLLLYATQGNATITKTIGATGDYPSITAAWAAIPGIESPITQPWIFELKSDYNIASETFPVNLTAIAGASATNNITIRPQAGATGINISTNSASDVFQLNGVDYLIIDGRLGGVGPRDLRIENTQTATNKHAITLTADATNNTIQYCEILGSSLSGGNNPQTNTVININDGGGVTNCDNTSISHCFISKSGTNRPASLIGVSGGSTSVTLDNLIVDNNEFSDCNIAAFYSGFPLSTCSITNNSIYQTSTWTTGSVLYGIFASHGSNGNLTINNNYIGGEAVNCGGGAMDIVCTAWNRPFYGIKVSSYGGNTNISGNYFQNITTSGGGNGLAGNYLVDVDGTSTYQIGTSGNGNTFGSMTGTGSLATTGGETTGYSCIYVRGSGDVTATYNNYGSVNIASNSNYSDRSYLKGIHVEGIANCTVSNSTFGGLTADNIAHTLNGVVYFFYSSSIGNYTVSDNTIQNIKVVGFTGTNLSLIYLNGNGNLTANNNSFSSISNASNSQAYFFRVNTSGTATITNNTIGSTSTNNLSSISGNEGFTACWFDGGGTFSYNNNIFQQAIQSGSSMGLYGVFVTTGTLNSDNNIFRNLTYTGGGVSAIYSLSSGSSNHSITNNSIYDCTFGGNFNAFYVLSLTTIISGNTIGGSSAGNMVLTSGAVSSGITFANSLTTVTISNNIIQNFTCTNASTSNKFNGIYIQIGTAVVTGNTITNISSATTDFSGSGSGTPYLGLNGIYVAVGDQTISGNTISNLITTGIGTTFNAYDVVGIYLTGATGTNLITKNRIEGLGAAGSEQTRIIGIYLSSTSDNNIYNNVIQLDNGTYASVGNVLTGIYNLSDGNNVIYHNTVKISGTKTSQNASTYCYRSQSTSGTDLQNNLFQNRRTNSGGSGTNYSIVFNSTPSPLTNNYNYLEASGTGGSIGITVSGNNNTGTVLNLDALGVPVNPTSSDVQNTGTNLTAIVPDDFNGITRNNPNPWRGAYESLPNPGTDGTVTICASDAIFNLFDNLGGNPTGGGTWSGPSVLTGSDLGTFDPSVNTAGVYTYTNGGSSADVTVTINAAPTVASITGEMEVCEGSTITLSNTTAGGTWSSVTPSVATIDASGIVSGVTGGTSDITYSVTSGGCTTDVTTTITVDTPPTVAAITGTTDVCIGSTITLSNTTAGGTWSSASTSVATIDAVGIVSGVTVGTSVITYTVSSGACTASQTTIVTVDGPTVEPILGAIGGCIGSTITLTDATAGGTWSSGTTSVATIDASGVVTGISAGSSVITYSVTSGGCTTTQTSTITFNAIPLSPIVSNDTSYCSSDEFSPMTATALGTGTITWFSDQALTTQITTGTSLTPTSTIGTITYYVLEDNNGCIGTPDSIKITINNCDLIIPTAFTPDGDNINDKWMLNGIDDLYPSNVVKIYNRWGGLLYESGKGLYEQSPWDGRFKGQDMPTASYYFIIEYNDDETEASKGTVTILRKQ